MPLIHGGSRADISQNISEMVSSGRPRRQAIAAALSTADRYGKKRADGGAASNDEPPDMSDQYNTRLSPQDEQNFQSWAKKNNRQNDTFDYDLRGAWQSGAATSASGHLPDTFKKPNHPTFSDQSQYNGIDGHQGGVWGGGQQNQPWTFTPSATNLKMYGPEALQSYFQQRERGNQLILPQRARGGFLGHRAAGGSAPTVPTYATAAPNVNASGYVPTPQAGGQGMDMNTGALMPQTQQMLQQFAMRGLPGGPQNAPAGMPGGPPAQASSDVGGGVPPVDTGGFVWGDNLTSGGGNKRGGRIGRYAVGGMPSGAEMAPWFTRAEAHQADHAPAGLVHTAGPGRTDNVPMSVAAGSHVIPADVVAGIGQGNTLAGAHALGAAMATGPGGIKLPTGPHRSTIPRPPAMAHLARGGDPQWEGQEIRVAKGGAVNGVKCIVAGGEWIMKPDEVERTEHNGKRGHEAVDAWIVERRKQDVKKLRKLPGPVKS